jgi:hypothetical protein
MAEYIIQDSTLTDIADAIRAKDGSSAPILTEDMADAIAAIPSGGGITPTGTKQISITQNGTTTEDVTQYANAEITVNVPSGASLPSVISKIDGGSFTLASDTAGNNHWISHNLGVLPKCIIIWTEDSDLRTSTSAVAQRYLLCSTLSLMDWVTGTTSNAMIPNHLFRNTNGATSNTGSPITQAAVGNYIQTTRSNNALGAAYYKAGVEYKWVAYA